MLDALARWNRWGGADLASGIPRSVLARLDPFLDSPEVVALVGPRRAGKTTVLYQVMDQLEARGVPRDAMLHVNLEEPALTLELGPPLLDRLYDTWRERVYPSGRGYLFLDEPQHVLGWERWVRARADTEDLKIYVTGSSSALLSRELGTLLTGRHATFAVRPLSFAETLHFRGVAAPARPELATAAPKLRASLRDFLRWGGLPEVVLAKDDRRREHLLRQYFDDILFKDVAMRHEIRDVSTLRALAVHLLTQTACLVSYQRLARVFDASVDMVRSYCAYLEEAFVVELLPYFSLKTAERRRRPQKVHAVDTGLRNAVCLTGAPDAGRLAETAVHAALASLPNDGLYYWKGKQEVDFAVRRGNAVARLIQVTSMGAASTGIPARERAALHEATAALPLAESLLIVGGATAPPTDDPSAVPLWRFLLRPSAAR